MESNSIHSTNSSHSTHSPEAGNEIVAAEAAEQPGVDELTGEAPSPSPTATTATHSSKHKGKKKVVSSVKRKREKKMKAERSSVWEHFTKFDQPLVEIVEGKETVVGNTKRVQCKYCPTHLACDSRENGTSSLKKHMELVCKGYPGRNNLEES
ncbi:putative transcription factor/ chromatin remodeling BED-type(Zn) family [Rosa chinensis]|uniref:Putative transcription factor/ chromatin remodeling BED-type(Zn) family n=1 Tax=Rosa chinensis TaxID=74649 RepID=A0A2P6PGT2_ROSCH|nr:putative transcription factor/ chromatin remodeling BED-type(Zn) family [Rosa chinensis]